MPHSAILNSLSLPLSMILVVLVAALLASGLERNRAALLLVVALSLNLVGDLMRGLIKSEVLDVNAADIVIGRLLRAPSSRRPRRSPIRRSAARSREALTACLGQRDAATHGPRLLLARADRARRSGTRSVDARPGHANDARPCCSSRSGSLRLLNAIRVSNRAEHELFTRSQVDELTGLPNRVQLVSAIGEVLDDTWRTESRPSLMQVNLDRFKNINDSLGHELANEVLCELGARLRGLARDIGAHIARPSGDEFVILDRDAGSSGARLRSRRVGPRRAQRAVHRRWRFGVRDVEHRLGGGVPKNRTITPEEFLRRADIATHRAKANGRNCIALFDESMQTSVTQRMDMENALYGAVERRELRLYHQPIVEIETGRISGFEALIRWRRDDGTLIAPADFIFIAEDTGLINTIGAWAMLEALTELRRWINEGIVEDTTTISVNVSPVRSPIPTSPTSSRRRSTRSGVPPHLLWLEVTESMMLSEPEIARSTLRRVRAMGVRLALDDFGTGYSSLSLLQQFPLQRIKIDRAFIQGVADRANDRSLVRTIVAMGSSMGLDVVAEGVESIHQLRVPARHRLRQGAGLSHQPSDPRRCDALDDGRPVGPRFARILRRSDADLGARPRYRCSSRPGRRARPGIGENG